MIKYDVVKESIKIRKELIIDKLLLFFLLNFSERCRFGWLNFLERCKCYGNEKKDLSTTP